MAVIQSTYTPSSVSSSLVAKAIITLNQLARNKTVEVAWVPGHSGFHFNEIVDSLAKVATSSNHFLDIPISKNEIRKGVLIKLRENWDTEWSDYPLARHTKRFYKGQDRFRAGKVNELSRILLRRFVHAVTGHNNLKYFQYLQDPEYSEPSCRFCFSADETFFHWLCSCSKFSDQREYQLYGKASISDIEWDISLILNFSFLPLVHAALDPVEVVEMDFDTCSSDSE